MRSLTPRLLSVPMVAVVILIAAVAAAGGVALGQFSSAFADTHVQVANVANDAHAVGAKTYLLTCGRQPVNRPKLYSLTCGDENVGVENLSWTGWGTAQAHATGRLVYNTCTPYCAAGNYVSAPVTVTAHGLVRKAGTAVYEKVTVSFTKKVRGDLAPMAGTWDVSASSR
ncbi:hypothetical protein Back2_28860 [Nocardioides baekrokdamisoli]|uniref:Uncharacterized protein n=1 Tax=Nocardioides baekrokdamisoli TaxID=1804624 RepID=A0A3G9J6F5_9ACTN|nr:hypothetical protein [Nocardioides baekrokdamisoli]BBH18599.1 hypothetical protein Back2_28860 [Nocardioides baekrokdamisoli]